MKIAIASGKGGTGKTTVTSSLASIWPKPLYVMDLDVEEPNLHLFLNPDIRGTEKAFIEVPKADEEKCDHCRACADLCQFKAISVLGEVLMVFPEMCHGCGGCLAICPQNALVPDRRELGELRWGKLDATGFLMGRLRVGEAMSPPLMRKAKEKWQTLPEGVDRDLIIDAPPGVSCPAVNAVMDADVIVLVTEPTPFGLYDLRLAHEAFLPLGKTMGLVINRAGLGDSAVYDFSRSSGLPIWAEIPFSREIATTYANSRIVAQASPEIRSIFIDLAHSILSAQTLDQEVQNA